MEQVKSFAYEKKIANNKTAYAEYVETLGKLQPGMKINARIKNGKRKASTVTGTIDKIYQAFIRIKIKVGDGDAFVNINKVDIFIKAAKITLPDTVAS